MKCPIPKKKKKKNTFGLKKGLATTNVDTRSDQLIVFADYLSCCCSCAHQTGFMRIKKE